MLPVRALAAFRTDPDLTLLVDRRALRLDEVAAAGLVIEIVMDLPGDAAKAYVLRGQGSNPMLATLTLSDRARYMRLMDRFYVPISPDAAVVSAFFDLIADIYDGLIHHSVNLETARSLLSTVLETAPPSPRILDFGCGTGLAREALRDLGIGKTAHIVGTDLSVEMLRHAAERGETVLTIEKWRADRSTYDGAIACFVLHYGVPNLDLVRIANSLAPGGRFAANFFKAGDSDIRRLVDLMSDAGLRLIRHTSAVSTSTSENPMLVFERPLC